MLWAFLHASTTSSYHPLLCTVIASHQRSIGHINSFFHVSFSALPNFPIPEFHPSPRPLGACCALQVHRSGQGAGRGAGRPGGALGVASGGGGPRGASRGTGGGSVSETVGSGRPWRQSSTSSRPLLPHFFFSFLSCIRVATTAQVLAGSICLAWGEAGEPHLYTVDPRPQIPRTCLSSGL